MIRLVLTDFDGTLARRDKTVSQVTQNVIARYRAKSGIFTIATGRMTEGILSQLDKAGLGDLDIPIASYQGARISTALTNSVIFSAPLDAEIAMDAVKACLSKGLFVQTYGDGLVVAERVTDDLTYYCRINEVNYTLVPSLVDYVSTHEVYKILAWVKEKDMDALRAEFTNSFGARCAVIRSSPVFLEFFSFLAGKGNALRSLANYYDIDMRDTLAFGDENNDISMVLAAGIGVAMDNATQALKDIADMIAPDCDQDGVAVILAQLNNLPMER